MARPRKCRRVCSLPRADRFYPDGCGENREAVILSIEEYECIRLIDHVGLTQEECADFMQVSRTTAQQIYQDARKKLARMLVNGLPLHIEGGTYELCEKAEASRCRGCCYRVRTGGSGMKIAIPLDENQKDVCITFGRAPYFLFCEGEKTEILANPAADAQGGAGLQAAQFLVDQGASALITVRCGQNAAEVFKTAGIEIYKSQAAGARENIQALEEGKLEKLTHFHAGFQGIQ